MSAYALPAHWSAVSILDAADRIMDFRGRTPKKLGMSWGGGDIPAISARNVRMGCVDFTEEFYLGSDALYRKWMTHGDMQRGDILITTEAPLGNVAAVPDERRYILSQRTVLIRPKRDLFDKTFFLKALQSPAFQRLLTENATGSTALGIQRRRLERLEVLAPPVDEQQRIGQALQNVDDLIAAFERLIAKKQAIKQGMMQQLLTGRTRLPGFTDDWRKIRLGDVASFSKGAGLPKADIVQDGTTPCIHYGELFTYYGAEIEAVVSRTNNISLPFRSAALDVLMPTSDVTPRGLAKASAVHSPGVILGGDILVIRPNRRVVYGPFLAHAIRQDANQVLQLVRGSTVYHLYAADMKNFTFTVPSVDEQREIAGALKDAETDIAALQDRLAKARNIKIGMMQQLLTGRTRLPVTEAAS